MAASALSLAADTSQEPTSGPEPIGGCPSRDRSWRLRCTQIAVSPQTTDKVRLWEAARREMPIRRAMPCPTVLKVTQCVLIRCEKSLRHLRVFSNAVSEPGGDALGILTVLFPGNNPWNHGAYRGKGKNRSQERPTSHPQPLM